MFTTCFSAKQTPQSIPALPENTAKLAKINAKREPQKIHPLRALNYYRVCVDLQFARLPSRFSSYLFAPPAAFRNLHSGLLSRARRDLSVTQIEFQPGKLLSSRKSLAPGISARGFSSSKAKIEGGMWNDPLPSSGTNAIFAASLSGRQIRSYLER